LLLLQLLVDCEKLFWCERPRSCLK